MEGFQNRSQTKSKALFIVLFLILGIFLVFKLTQDGSKYAPSFNSPSGEVQVSQNPAQANKTAPKKTEDSAKNLGILKSLIDNIGAFNETFSKFDQDLRNFTDIINETLPLNVTLPIEWSWGREDYDKQRDEFLKKLWDLKEAFESATNGTL